MYLSSVACQEILGNSKPPIGVEAIGGWVGYAVWVALSIKVLYTFWSAIHLFLERLHDIFCKLATFLVVVVSRFFPEV